jgi:hypothetical protein
MFIMGALLTLIKLDYSGKFLSNCHILNMTAKIINCLLSRGSSRSLDDEKKERKKEKITRTSKE